jgi:hypothetical protein
VRRYDGYTRDLGTGRGAGDWDVEMCCATIVCALEENVFRGEGRAQCEMLHEVSGIGLRWVGYRKEASANCCTGIFTGVLAVKAKDAGRVVGMTGLEATRLDVTREAETLRQTALEQQRRTEINCGNGAITIR